MGDGPAWIALREQNDVDETDKSVVYSSGTEFAALHAPRRAIHTVGRDGMKSAIVLAALVSLVSVAAAKPLKPVRLAVYDATGKMVGRVLQVGTPEISVPVLVNGTTVILAVRKDAIGGNRTLFFASTDCSGTPYVFADANSLLETTTTVAGPGWTIYKQQPGAPAQTILAKSRREVGDCVGPLTPTTTSVFPAVRCST
jgi:hypothetical protein